MKKKFLIVPISSEKVISLLRILNFIVTASFLPRMTRIAPNTNNNRNRPNHKFTKQPRSESEVQIKTQIMRTHTIATNEMDTIVQTGMMMAPFMCYPEMEYKEQISEAILQKKWNAVHASIECDRSTVIFPSSICSCQCKKMHCPLILAAQMNPPISIINSMIQANPLGLFERDCSGKLPLHLACEFGAEPEVVKRLALMNKSAVSTKDNSGRNPLILACKSYLENVDPLISREDANQCLVDVLEILLDISPDCVLEEDCDGICSIEHALRSDVNIDVVETLQKASERRRKSKRHTDDIESKKSCKRTRIC